MKNPKPYLGSQPYIFISYSHKDMNIVLPIIRKFQAEGFRIWYDEGINPGSEYAKTIAKRLINCFYYVSFLSKNFFESKYCVGELNFAHTRDKKILNIHLDDYSMPDYMELWYGIYQSIWMDRYADETAFFHKFLSTKEIEFCKESNENTTSESAEQSSAVMLLPEEEVSISQYINTSEMGNMTVEQPTEETDETSFVIQNGILVRYRGTAQCVSIPQGVSIIGSAAFQACSTVQIIKIPEGVTRIEEMAFADCQYLTTVEFPKSLKIINNKAFMNCQSLQSASFQGALTLVGVSVFAECTSLRSVSFDCPIEKIGFDTFLGCSSLEEILIGRQSYFFKSIDGVLFDYECTHLEHYPAGKKEPNYSVPDTVIVIEEGAFYGSINLEYVELPQHTKVIGTSAFRDCSKLRKIVLSEGLETVKASAFQGCISLETFDFPAETTYIGKYAFAQCEQLESITLPSKITELYKGTFQKCKKLAQIHLPAYLSKIGEQTFMDSGLTEIFIPYGITKIENLSFAYCTELHMIFLSDHITQIAQDAIKGCNNALTIYGMPNTAAENFAKQKNRKFEQMFSITSGAGYFALHNYKGAFSYIAIPPNVNIIAENAFYHCKTLRTIDIPSSVGVIEKYAFAYCDNLESIFMTNLIIRIGEGAFEHCPALTKIDIVDMSYSYAPKIQHKIHRNFYKILQSIHPQTAEDYANHHNVSSKNALFDFPFLKQIQKESQDYITKLSNQYVASPLTDAILDTIVDEAQKSDTKLSQIELFLDSVIIIGTKGSNTSQRKYFYKDLNVNIQALPNIDHIRACARVIVRSLGHDYELSPEHHQNSVVIRQVWP